MENNMEKNTWKDYILSTIVSIAVFVIIYLIITSNIDLYNQEIFNCNEKFNNMIRLLLISPSIICGIATFILSIPKNPQYRNAINYGTIICLIILIGIWLDILGLHFINNTYIEPLCVIINY